MKFPRRTPVHVDALSEVLGYLRMSRTRWACTIATAPWGLSLRETSGSIRFHYVVRGSCWLSVEGTSHRRVALSGGDLVVVTHGNGHAIRDQPRSSITRFERLEPSSETVGDDVAHVRIGGSGAETSIISGAFIVDEPVDTPMLPALPPLIRMTPAVDEAVPSFLQNLHFIAREIDSGRPGSRLVLTRMADVIFVQILRAHIESLPEGSEGFLGALRDKNIAMALGLMHKRPEEHWTVAHLADAVGLSRSGFAARFAELVGTPPLGYLTRLRMMRASALLRTGATLAQASETIGYSSEASFSHAFRQWAGVSPGVYRRRVRSEWTASTRSKLTR